MKRIEACYALYRGDQFIDIGTAKELAEKRGISVKSLRYKATPTYHKRTSYTDAVRAYKIQDI